MPSPGQPIGNSYIPSESYMGETRYLRIPSEQARSPRFGDQHFTDHALFGVGDYRVPRTLPTKDIFRSPSPGYESPDMQSRSYRYHQGAEPAESSYRYFSTPRSEGRQPLKPSNRPSEMRPAPFSRSRTQNVQGRHSRPEEKSGVLKSALVNSGHASPHKPMGTPKKTVHFADDYLSGSASPKRTATTKSRHQQTPAGSDDDGAASGAQAGRTAHASKTLAGAATSDSRRREGQTRHNSYYRVPPTPRIQREPTPDLETKSPHEWDPARHRFCDCCPPPGAGHGSGASVKMYRRLDNAREHIARTSKGTRRIGEA